MMGKMIRFMRHPSRYLKKSEPVYGEQNHAEIKWLLEELRERNCRSVLEIGSRTGNTLRMFATICRDKVRAIDIDANGGPQLVIEELRRQGIDADCLIASSTDQSTVEWARKNGPYDFIFVDGDHEIGAALDWINYCQFTSLMGFHDIAHNYFLSRKLWWALKLSGAKTKEFIAEPEVEQMGIGLLEMGKR
jgi:SAM-dependent methyltransferase